MSPPHHDPLQPPDLAPAPAAGANEQSSRDAGPRRAPAIGAGYAGKMLRRVHELAAAHGGRCLSASYAGGLQPGRFVCAVGHEWATAFREVLAGSWCPACVRVQDDAERRVAESLLRLQALAQARGGQCLSETYLGPKMRHRVRCAEGHEWEALGSSLLRGSWCWVCHQVSHDKGLQAMHDMAAARGGQCLASHYRNFSQRLSWVCHLGHTWKASWDRVQQHWCPECALMSGITKGTSKARQRPGPDTRLAQDPALDEAPEPAVP
jgi:hypothetical protein